MYSTESIIMMKYLWSILMIFFNHMYFYSYWLHQYVCLVDIHPCILIVTNYCSWKICGIMCSISTTVSVGDLILMKPHWIINVLSLILNASNMELVCGRYWEKIFFQLLIYLEFCARCMSHQDCWIPGSIIYCFLPCCFSSLWGWPQTQVRGSPGVFWVRESLLPLLNNLSPVTIGTRKQEVHPGKLGQLIWQSPCWSGGFGVEKMVGTPDGVF